EAEQHRGLGETLADDALGILDLSAAARQRLAVHDLDQHGDVPGLHEIKEILAQKVDHGAHRAEADEPAPRAECAWLLGDIADEVADSHPDAGHEHIGERDAEIDQKSKDQERHRPSEQADDTADAEIHRPGLLEYGTEVAARIPAGL